MHQQKDTLRMKELARKWQEGTITEEERILFNQWYHSFDDVPVKHIPSESTAHLKKRLYKNIIQNAHIPVERSWFRKNNTYIFSAAASIALMFSIAGYLYLSGKIMVHKNIAVLQAENIILPGVNKAVLTLADGSVLVLDEKTKGLLGTQANVAITKSTGGRVSYEIAKHKNYTGNAVAYNIITTPRGGQYQLNLSDGTKVWLNAASTLRFPVAFKGDKRVVELTGEAYFEVNPKPLAGKRKSKIPFLIKTHHQLVTVLGTHFNVNAYDDEPDTKTTLLKGSVKVTKLTSQRSAILKPGQQSMTIDSTAITGITVINVDASQSIEWQKGYFSFDHESVESIMRKISRWYNIDVDYKGNIRYRKFGGRISKFENISEVLQVMEKTQVIHFEIQGRRIVVMP